MVEATTPNEPPRLVVGHVYDNNNNNSTALVEYTDHSMTTYQDQTMSTTKTKSYDHPDMVPPPDIAKLKRRRRVAASTVGVVGGVTGLLVGGPIGAVALGVGGGLTVKAIGKRRERRKMRKYNQRRQEAVERSGYEEPSMAIESAYLG